MYLFNKNKILLEKYTNYLNLCADTIEIFKEAIEYSMNSGLDEHYGVLAKKVHGKESDADSMRRIIECEMYEQSLLPESREELLDIIERIDAVPNGADHLANLLMIQKTEIIPSIKKDVSELLAISLESFKYTREAALDCFMKMKRMKELQTLIKNTESIGDGLEHEMVRKIFEEKMETGDKLVQKDIVFQIGDICNMCEHVMDRIVICSIKRKL
jgi:predicted phosphate transport protein (TIGR00153 family)